MNHGTVMYRASPVLTAVGMYDASLRGYSGDFRLWIRLLRHGRVMEPPSSYYLCESARVVRRKGFNAANDAFLRIRKRRAARMRIFAAGI